MEYEAHAKINLLLNVLGRRPDGYHELCTIMHAIDLCDTVSLEPAKEISVEADVPLPERSAARRAAEAYRDAAGTGGARISIRCRIPAEAGLGSSSADAAAVLQLISRQIAVMRADRLRIVFMILHAFHNAGHVDLPLMCTQEHLKSCIPVFRADAGIKLLVYYKMVCMCQDSIFRRKHIYSARICLDVNGSPITTCQHHIV